MTSPPHILYAGIKHISRWRPHDARRPYWRLYWHPEPGGMIATETVEEPMTPDRLILVAPLTQFMIHLTKPTDHHHFHFQLANPLDHAKPGLYPLPLTPPLVEDLKTAVHLLKTNAYQRDLAFARLVSGACLALPDTTWEIPEMGLRFSAVIIAMTDHLDKPLSNQKLASIAQMPTSSFVRNFTRLFHESPQAFYMQRRLAQASHLLEQTGITIEEVAEACGFCDRNYFTSVFTRKTGISPAAFRYRKNRE